MNKKPVAIIGSGFLASNLILGLEKKGYPIHVFSRSRPKVDIQNTTKFHAIDLKKDAISSEDLVLCNKIFFMLSIGVPGHQNSAENFELEFSILKSIVIVANSLSIKDFYFVSSSAVYGDRYTQVITEDEELNPKSEYAKYKIKMEDYLLGLKSESFNPVVLRISNPYGQFQYSQGIVQKIIEAKKYNNVVRIDNNGKSVRDFIYITDCICMIISLMEINNRFSVYNISSGIGTNINELLKLLKNFGIDPLVQYSKLEQRPKSSVSILDNSRILNESKQCELIKLHDGIKKLLTL